METTKLNSLLSRLGIKRTPEALPGTVVHMRRFIQSTAFDEWCPISGVYYNRQSIDVTLVLLDHGGRTREIWNNPRGDEGCHWEFHAHEYGSVECTNGCSTDVELELMY